MEFKDKVILCEDCKKEFTHTVADQEQFAAREFRWEPKRCPDCRKARKERKAARPRGETGSGGIGPVGGSSSWGGRGRYDRPERRGGGGFRSGGYGGGGRSGGGGGGFGGAPRQSFEATCATCGAKTTVPFEPTQGREVYCRECYRKKEGR